MSKRLGKGLDALFASNVVEQADQGIEISLQEIRPNPYQPRKEFDPEALEELVQSIKEHGIIQPLIVRNSIKGYELVAGERRLRAAKMAGLKKVPVVIKEYTDQQLMEIALIENIQRENLNPIEEAGAYQKLMKLTSITQEELAQKIGKSRPHVTNILRLLQLPAKIRDMVSNASLSMGHARALLAVENSKVQWELANEVVKKQLSVRQLEELVKSLRVSRETKPKKKATKDQAILDIENRLRNRLGTSVQIKSGGKKGKIEIEFYSNEDLQRLIEFFDV